MGLLLSTLETNKQPTTTVTDMANETTISINGLSSEAKFGNTDGKLL
jgi:hypothetical protein